MRTLTLKLLVVTAMLATAAPASAQSLGEAARQQRARRASTPASGTRVLTNEDLKRERILEPRVAPPAQAAAPHAGAPQPSTTELPAIPALPPSEKVVPLWSAAPNVNTAPAPEPTQVTLGDYARQVRAERAARRRVREILAQREQEKAPIILASPPAPPVPQQRSAPVLAAVPSRPQARPVKRRASARRPRIMLAAAEAVDVVTVQRGDSLWKIAQRELGDGRLWTALWQANPEIADPHLIYAGEKLRRPAAQVIAQQKSSRTPSMLRAERRSQPPTTSSFATQVLGNDTRKAAIRTGETLPAFSAPAPADSVRRGGPHRAPR